MTQQPSWLDGLNAQQRAAATHGDGPVLVVAGAGSGKTRTLACRVAVLLERGVAPERILLLTFTRRAAQEMLDRASSAVRDGQEAVGRVWGGTFHAVSHRLLRIHGQAVGLPTSFSIVDQSDAQDMLNVIRHEMGFSSTEKRFPRKNTCLAAYSRCMNTGEDLPDVLDRWYPWCTRWTKELTELFRTYVERKQEQALLDYDDLLSYWFHLLEGSAAAQAVEDRFDHVLVDEYQDTNPVQAGILRFLRRRNSNIMAVGDDAQSIYSFRGATVRNMLDFPKHFPGTTVITLEQNYRSVGPILETTNRLIAQARERFSKQLWSARQSESRPALLTCSDETEQDKRVIDLVLHYREQGVDLRRQAVLFRAGHHSNSLELALTRRGVPFRKYGGLRFVETAHIKDLVCFLRLLENPRDQMAWFRLLQLIDGIGPATAGAAFRHVADSAASASSIGTFHAPSAARGTIASMAQMFRDIEKRPEIGPALDIDRVLIFYKPLLERNHENPEPRIRDIEHLAALSRAHRTRADFLAALALDPPVSTADLADTPDRDEDYLILSTIHSAKGGEWDVVYVIHASDGFLPSDMACGDADQIEEELRLTYVAMTRARDWLYVTWPLRYFHRGPNRLSDSHSFVQCCRFLTREVRETMDEAECAPPSAETDSPQKVDTVIDVGERLRKRWGC